MMGFIRCEFFLLGFCVNNRKRHVRDFWQPLASSWLKPKLLVVFYKVLSNNCCALKKEKLDSIMFNFVLIVFLRQKPSEVKHLNN